MNNGLKILCGNAGKEFRNDICEYLRWEYNYNKENIYANIETTTFSDGETKVEIKENLRGYDVFVVQPLCYPTNHNIIELCLILDALKRASVKRITAVIPYYSYARQDRKSEPRAPISAKAIANLLEISGVDRVLTMDLHAGQIQGFFDVPVDNLYASKVLLDRMREEQGNLCLVSPDVGGIERANYYSKRLNSDLGICYKYREKAGVVSEMKILGDVKDKKCIIVDDIIDSGSTIIKCSELLLENGACSVHAYGTHGVFSGNSLKNLTNSSISKIVITDTIPPNNDVMMNTKFEIVSTVDLFSNAIVNIFRKNSVSKLFV